MLAETHSLTRLLNGLRSAGEDTRLRLLAVLARNELTVSELGKVMGQSVPRVSRHLKLLCEGQLLERHQEGSWVFYRVADRGPGARIARAILDLLPTDDPELEVSYQRLARVREEHARLASDYFEGIAEEWDAIRRLYISEEEIERELVDACGSRDINLLLDLGTGTGRLLQVFSPRISSGIGIDQSRQMLTLARANLESSASTNCQVRQGDILNLNIASGTADVAVLHHVLHFLDDPASAITEAARVISDSGLLLIADFSPHQLESLRREHAHRRLGFADDEINAWLGAAGLELRETRKLHMKSGADTPDALTVTIWVATCGDHNPEVSI